MKNNTGDLVRPRGLCVEETLRAVCQQTAAGNQFVNGGSFYFSLVLTKDIGQVLHRPPKKNVVCAVPIFQFKRFALAFVSMIHSTKKMNFEKRRLRPDCRLSGRYGCVFIFDLSDPIN